MRLPEERKHITKESKMSDDRLLTIPQAADLLGKSETYVRDRIKNETFAAMEVGQGKKRRKFKVAESKMLDHKKMLDAKEKDRASRRKPKLTYRGHESALECQPAAQVEMFSCAGTVDLLEKLLAEQKKTNEQLTEITKGVAAIQKDCCDIKTNLIMTR